jgi:uncharacterized membrane protein SirB2
MVVRLTTPTRRLLRCGAPVLPSCGHPGRTRAIIEFYSEIRLIHIVLAISTGVLFTLRGLLVQAGRAALANHVVVRYLSYTIDTALLAAYVVLGSLALKRAPTPASRLACFVGALAAYGLMIGIARSHDPRGWLLWLGS